MAQLTKPNILHNWDFRNPVNQRQLSTYTIGANTYFIDRWKSSVGSLVADIVNGGMNVEKSSSSMSFCQAIEKGAALAGKEVTLSVMLIDDTIYTYTVTVPTSGSSPNSNVGINGWIMYLQIDGENLLFMLNPYSSAASLDIAAVKLELGTYSTLDRDPPMEYGKELAVCQRYQLNTGNTTIAIRPAQITANAMTFLIPTPVTMRANPVLEKFTTFAVRSMADVEQTGFSFAFTALAGCINVLATKTGHGLTDGFLQVSSALFNANL